MDELIERYLGYAHAIAAELAGKYPPNITRSDLESAAELGLVQAAHSYDPARSASFTTFAYYRIRGAILDEVRKSWQAAHVKADPEDLLGEAFGRTPPQAGDPYSGLQEVNASRANNSLISLETLGPEHVPTTTDSADNEIIKKEEAEALQRALQQLPERHRFILQAHYFQDRSLVGIGLQLNLSKSWVSRLHTQALLMVRKNLQRSRGPCGSRRCVEGRR